MNPLRAARAIATDLLLTFADKCREYADNLDTRYADALYGADDE